MIQGGTTEVRRRLCSCSIWLEIEVTTSADEKMFQVCWRNTIPISTDESARWAAYDRYQRKKPREETFFGCLFVQCKGCNGHRKISTFKP